MTAVTLGPAGTYSHRATQAIADEIEFRASVTQIVEAVATSAHDRGVIPIENSIEGSVTESLDALRDVDIAIVRELVTPIRHGLLAQTPEFTTVASHPQALAQCRALGDDMFYLDIEAGFSEDRLQVVSDTVDDRISEGWVRQLDSDDRMYVRPKDSDECLVIEGRATMTHRRER